MNWRRLLYGEVEKETTGVTSNKGGYHAGGRLESTLDAISMEAQSAAASPSADVWRRAFLEILQLAYDARKLVSHMNGGVMPCGGLVSA